MPVCRRGWLVAADADSATPRRGAGAEAVCVIGGGGCVIAAAAAAGGGGGGAAAAASAASPAVAAAAAAVVAAAVAAVAADATLRLSGIHEGSPFLWKLVEEERLGR